MLGLDYDPDNAAIILSNPSNQAIPHPNLNPNPNPFPPENHPYQDSGRGRGGRKRGGGGRGGKKGGSRAAFSAEGPVTDQTKTTIVVENIPEESCSEEEVRRFFSQFGDILEVSMQPHKHLAVVRFDNWESANAAYRSPKVIFDNRFVKVFWYKDSSNSANPQSAANGFKHNNGDQAAENAAAEPEMDPEEFQRRQEEAQRQFQEKETKRSALEQQRQELEKKQQELLEKHREQTQRLRNKLQEKNGNAATAGDSSGGDAANGGTSSSGTGADMLRAKLAALEQEAKILGIDPDAPTVDDELASTSSYAPRGGWRGRGAPRARGRGSWRGGQASFRGGGLGGRHAAYAQFSIDNRPKKLAITGVDFTVPEKDESLRHFLLVGTQPFVQMLVIKRELYCQGIFGFLMIDIESWRV